MAETWTSIERVRTALEHQEADRIPFDVGGSILTGINKVAYQRLRAYLGLPEKPLEILDPIQQLAKVHQDFYDRFLVDARAVDPASSRTAPLARETSDQGDHYAFTDDWGIGWKMPKDGGLYFDMCKHPLADAESVADLEKFAWPDSSDPARFVNMKQQADRFTYEEKKAYILGRHAPGIFETAWWMRGFEKFFMDLVLDPGFACALMDIITEHKMRYWECAFEAVGDNLIVVYEADDLGSQRGPLISLDMYKKFIAPCHKKLFNFMREKAAGKYYLLYHTCGAVREVLPYLIESGIDILNPVQVSAAGMDTAELKRLFGKDLSFWGGGIDTQYVLPHGTRQEIRDEVKRRIDDLAPGGGFIFNTVHNVQGDVPPENFMAMWEAWQEFGGY